ncbi:hypothetical protein [Burkholderia vietnamiensis]|uniref:hypothetical protein n=1 Tax=Burkholderia vietnamiensis TaxID=60552 RepID=UPI000A635101|nr:hypothetical protein [Burkholderia vietnamiensis]
MSTGIEKRIRHINQRLALPPQRHLRATGEKRDDFSPSRRLFEVDAGPVGLTANQLTNRITLNRDANNRPRPQDRFWSRIDLSAEIAVEAAGDQCVRSARQVFLEEIHTHP